MWQPTHVKVTIKQARSLITKGKNGTNDAFVVIGIGKEKYQTSLKEKAPPTVEWKEECELEIPSQGNKAAIMLTVYHRNSLGLDEFLGQVNLSLSDFDVYEKPKFRWYRLRGKPEKDKKKGEKDRGDLEVMVNFSVRSESFSDLTKKEKHKSSISSLQHIGGSLLSLGSKDKLGLKNFARSVNSKMDKITKHKKRKSKNSSGLPSDLSESQQKYDDADPGVISDEDDDFRFDEDIRVNTRYSSPHSTMSRGSSLMQDQVLDTEFDIGSYDDHNVINLSKSSPNRPTIFDETKERSTVVTGTPPDCKATYSERVTSFSEPQSYSGVNVIHSPPKEAVKETSAESFRYKTEFGEEKLNSKSGFGFDSPKKGVSSSLFIVQENFSQSEDAIGDYHESASNGSRGDDVLVSKEPKWGVGGKHVSCTQLNKKRDVAKEASLTRTASLSEKQMTEPAVDEWERKLYGRSGITGSTENVSGSRTSLGSSRGSSTHEVRRDNSFTRLPEVKMLSLERKQAVEEEGDVRKQKKSKGISGFKHRFFHTKNDRDGFNEDSRIVEGGNDRLPAPPSRPSRLPHEVHEKYAGKSREDLVECILSLQSEVGKQAKQVRDLEDYIDNLLLRVMEVNPQILQAPISKRKIIKMFSPY